MRRVALALAALLVLVVGLVLFLVVHDFDSPDLGRALLDKVSAATGATITARTFRLNLLKGLKLEGVEVKADGPGRTCRVTLDTLLFEHRLGPLLSGTVAIDQILFDHPVIEIVEAAGGPPAAAGTPTAPPPQPAPAPVASGEGRKLSLELKALTIQDGRLSIVDQQQPAGRLQFEGLTIHLRDVGLNPSAGSLAAISGTGDLALSKATLNAAVLTDVRSQFQLANGAFTMPELSTRTAFGSLTSSMTLDLKPAPFTYGMKATGSAIDLNALLGTSGGLGPGAVQFDADGQGPDAAAIKARGSIALAEGKIPSTKMSAAVDKALGKNVLGGTTYKASQLTFALNRGVLTLSPFRFETPHARVDLEGTAALAGPLDVDVSLATPREGIAIDGIGGATLDVLSDASGWVPIPISVSGTLDDPAVRPDKDALLAQAKAGAKRETKEAVQTAAQDARQKAGTALRKKIKK